MNEVVSEGFQMTRNLKNEEFKAAWDAFDELPTAKNAARLFMALEDDWNILTFRIRNAEGYEIAVNSRKHEANRKPKKRKAKDNVQDQLDS